MWILWKSFERKNNFDDAIAKILWYHHNNGFFLQNQKVLVIILDTCQVLHFFHIGNHIARNQGSEGQNFKKLEGYSWDMKTASFWRFWSSFSNSFHGKLKIWMDRDNALLMSGKRRFYHKPFLRYEYGVFLAVFGVFDSLFQILIIGNQKPK